MEKGGIFRELGILNFLEGDFFGWYLDVWDDALDKPVRRVVSELANYSLVTLDVDPEQTRDLLKELYQNVMPKQVRHNLGQYYTPDWLAERLLNQLGYDGDLTKRLLDPSCGSGTFLVLAIQRAKQAGADALTPETQVLQRILGNVYGFDLDPLAVMSARTNYLLALGDLLQHRQGDVSIPVYLADSILTPAQMEELVGRQMRMMAVEERQYRLKTVVGSFAIPGSLVTAQYVDQLAGLLESSVELKDSIKQFMIRLVKTFPLSKDRESQDLATLQQLYERLLELDKAGINGIWARIIKNAFAPLFAGTFDFVAGNPPWVNWDALPEGYRKDLVPLNQDVYLLFPHRGLRARLGSAEIDLSTLMTYVALDQYLSTTGRLGFVITQSLFKSHAGQGFRRFDIRGQTPVKVLHVDDMVSLRPFEGAANRTSVLVIQKGQRTKYPLPYTVWRKRAIGTRLPEHATLNRIFELTSRSNFIAVPIDKSDPTSPWLTAKPKAVRAIAKLLGPSDYKAHVGVHSGGANSVVWLNILNVRPDGKLLVANVLEGAKRKADFVQAAIEPDFVFPLLRGRDVSKWFAEPSLHIVAPQQPGREDKAVPESELRTNWPKTFAYLKRFEELFLSRKSGVVRTLMEAGPFYALYGIKNYTFTPWKVVWKEIATRLTAAVVGPSGGHPVLPDHKLTLCATSSKSEAHYLCAVLNSSPAIFAVGCFTIQTQISTHVLQNLRVPLFDPRSSLHQELASLSEDAHEVARAEDLSALTALEQQIDQACRRLWNLSDTELEEIQRSLAELTT